MNCEFKRSGVLPAMMLGLFSLSDAGANTLLFKDNFDTANTANLDAAPLTGRLTGTLATTVFPRSAKILQTIAGNKLSMVNKDTNNTGRVRFQNSAGWHNWASGTEGTTILADGGLRVEFDWTPINNTDANWIAWSIGHSNVEPGYRVIDGGTDYGILLRNNGNSARFTTGNGIGNGAAYTPPVGVRHVVIDCAFSSFADGSSVVARIRVDGNQITTDNFSWVGDNGVINMELETNVTGQLIDNFTVSTLPPEFTVALSPSKFASGSVQGDFIGTFSGSTLAGGVEPSTFTFVAGTGDTHNGRFQINGDSLEAGTYNFAQDPGGTQYFIRVRGTGTNSGGIKEAELVLTLIKDDDKDGIPDVWELQFAGNLTSLNGLAFGPGPGAGSGDFDGDRIIDIDEYHLSESQFPGINPVVSDSDGDGLKDGDEIVGAGLRPITSPTVADTDKDGLSDGAESNTGTIVNSTDTGSNPTVADTDFDGSRDGFEVQKGSNPVDNASRPVLPSSVALVQLTDDASTGISTGKTYTHLVSGGEATTVNGVAFQALSTVLTPTNFTWTKISAGNKFQILNNTNNWVPANGGVTGPGLTDLLNSFAYTTGGNAGDSQTFTLSGLTPGTTYQLHLYVRGWNTMGDSGRPVDLVFTNGATVVQPFGGLLEDRPGIVLNNANKDSAYYLSYTYVAEGTELSIDANVHPSSVPVNDNASGNLHLYGLTNEVAPATALLKLTSVSRNGSGDFIINFAGAPNTIYKVTKSPDLVVPFGPLTIPLTSTTDGSGIGQAIVPSSETSEPKEFYRVEK